MANLTPSEKELLPVIRYANSKRKEVARLVTKLTRNFDMETVCDMTGFSVKEIDQLITVNSVPGTKPKRKNTTERQIEQSKKDRFDLFEPEPTGNSRRLAIHLSAESDLPQRLAHDMAAHITREMKPGDTWFSRKEVMAKFDCGSASLTVANGILLKHNWIELAEPGNFRKGYVVK